MAAKNVSIGGAIMMAALAMVAPAQAFEFEVLHTFGNIRADQDDQHNSPLTSDNLGNTYFALMNTSNQILVGQISIAGAVETVTLAPLQTGQDRWHSRPSVGVDLNGMIHLSGPMHNEDFDYLISNSPRNVLTGFDRKVPEQMNLDVGGGSVGGAPRFDGTNDAISYCRFTNDGSGKLWVSYRMRVGNAWSDNIGGTQAGALGRYNETSGSWDMSGGNSNPLYAPSGNASPKAPAFVWSEHTSIDSGSYQSHSAKPYVDATGQMHFAFKHDRAPAQSGGWSQDILYFYSDDHGLTWATADGQTVAGAPIAITGTPSAVMTANTPSGTNNVGDAYTAVSNGRPVVAWTDRSNGYITHFSIFANGTWQETNTGIAAYPSRLIIDTNNVWYLVAGRFIYSSTNDGQSWKSYDSGISSSSGLNASVDMPYFMRTNKIRYLAMPSGTSVKTATIVEFTSDEWSVTSTTTPMPPLLANN
jgi:hypothetical protein